MTDLNNGGGNANPQNQGVADPAAAQNGQPAQPNPPVNSGIEGQMKELTTKLETLTNQYNGSTKEALRLKEENESLKKKVAEVSQATVNGTTEDGFQKLVDQHGFLKAISMTFGGQVTSLQEKLDSLMTKEAEKVLENFKAVKKGLANAEVFKKFEEEYQKLQGVYSNVSEAMEKAYVLAGGVEAENSATPAAPQTPTPSGDPNAQKVLNNVSAGSTDSRPTPVANAANASDIQKQINDLTTLALNHTMSGQAQKAALVFSQIEDLKGQLGAKV